MISKTKINKRIKRKTNSKLVETILLAKKKGLLEIAKLLSLPTRKRIKKNLEEISKEAKENEAIIVPGKVLGQGNIDKKIKIIALDFSSTAKEKLKNAKCEVLSIKKELEKNKKLEGKILK